MAMTGNHLHPYLRLAVPTREKLTIHSQRSLSTKCLDSILHKAAFFRIWLAKFFFICSKAVKDCEKQQTTDNSDIHRAFCSSTQLLHTTDAVSRRKAQRRLKTLPLDFQERRQEQLYHWTVETEDKDNSTTVRSRTRSRSRATTL